MRKNAISNRGTKRIFPKVFCLYCVCFAFLGRGEIPFRPIPNRLQSPDTLYLFTFDKKPLSTNGNLIWESEIGAGYSLLMTNVNWRLKRIEAKIGYGGAGEIITTNETESIPQMTICFSGSRLVSRDPSLLLTVEALNGDGNEPLELRVRPGIGPDDFPIPGYPSPIFIEVHQVKGSRLLISMRVLDDDSPIYVALALRSTGGTLFVNNNAADFSLWGAFLFDPAVRIGRDRFGLFGRLDNLACCRRVISASDWAELARPFPVKLTSVRLATGFFGSGSDGHRAYVTATTGEPWRDFKLIRFPTFGEPGSPVLSEIFGLGNPTFTEEGLSFLDRVQTNGFYQMIVY